MKYVKVYNSSTGGPNAVRVAGYESMEKLAKQHGKGHNEQYFELVPVDLTKEIEYIKNHSVRIEIEKKRKDLLVQLEQLDVLEQQLVAKPTKTETCEHKYIEDYPQKDPKTGQTIGWVSLCEDCGEEM